MATAAAIALGVVNFAVQTWRRQVRMDTGRSCKTHDSLVSFLGERKSEGSSLPLHSCGCGKLMFELRFADQKLLVDAGWDRRKRGNKPNSLKSQFFPSGNGERNLRLCRANQEDFGFCLHDLLDQAGIETKFARVARTGFLNEVTKLAGQQCQPVESTRRGDLSRAVLEIAAEDDALVSHSAVPLPVDMYLERLDMMAAEFAGHHLPSHDPRNPRSILQALDNYLYVYKGFRRTSAEGSRNPRDFYLNGVLTRRLGTPVMLGLIYSEVVNRLKQRGAVEFVVQLQLPKSGDSLCHPQALVKEHVGAFEDATMNEPNAGNEAAGKHQNLLTSELVLSEVLRSLKSLYWPWKPENGLSEESGFLDAARAINRGPVSFGSTVHGPFESLFTTPSRSRGSDVARARAAQYRLQRGIWTSTAFGDLRCALAASERLVTLGLDKTERRDYGALLFHCGLYEQAFQYLDSYFLHSEASSGISASCKPLEVKEIAALELLLERLKLILTERSWDSPPQPPQPIPTPPEPW